MAYRKLHAKFAVSSSQNSWDLRVQTDINQNQVHLIKSWGTGITNCALLMILYCSCSCFMVLSYTVIMSNNIVIPCANRARPYCWRRLLPASSYIIVYFLGQHSEIHLDNVIVIVGDGDNDNDNDNTQKFLCGSYLNSGRGTRHKPQFVSSCSTVRNCCSNSIWKVHNIKAYISLSAYSHIYVNLLAK